LEIAVSHKRIGLIVSLLLLTSLAAGMTAEAENGSKERPARGEAKAKLPRPIWARQVGKDRVGVWANLVVGPVTQRMRLILPGTFVMGTPHEEALEAYEGTKALFPQSQPPPLSFFDSTPQHQVTLTQAFWLGDTAVTQELWEVVMQGNPAHYKGKTNPVEQVSWNDCEMFFAKLNAAKAGLRFGFPTEAQWEYACRAGSTENRYGPIDDIAWYFNNANAMTHPVAKKLPNAWGLFDMIGNVAQLVSDWEADYPTSAVTDPTGPATGTKKVTRGGGFIGYAWFNRAASRGAATIDERVWNLGVRLYAPFDEPAAPDK
jgi:formylglycine-generating enzyme required for sulfatase activity